MFIAGKAHRTHMGPKQVQYGQTCMGPTWVPFTAHIGPILVPYGSHMDVPRWVPDESLLQNPHESHMGCPYRTHIKTHMGPIFFACWV